MPATPTSRASDAAISRLDVSVYRIPTPAPEADGTFEWDATTLVVIEVEAGGQRGIGYTYADRATAVFVQDHLWPAIRGKPVLDVEGCWLAMRHAVRNLGRSGIAAMARAAVDVALWDLKARLLDRSLVKILGAARARVAAYGSGGFTSLSVDELRTELGGWASDGFARVKMKIGRDAAADRMRVSAARQAIGQNVELFVDANGAYTRTEAQRQADAFAASGVTWFEEPVEASDAEGLRLVRDRAPAGMAITAGEYGYELDDFARLLDGGSVDVLQADATRCAGVTGFLAVSALCDARHVPLSTHCAPSLHAPLACAARAAVHVEYFIDHSRIEHLAFEGALAPAGGWLTPDVSRPGLGLELKRADLERYRVA